MKVGVRALRNNTADVIAAVQSGERVTLTVRGDPVADIVPHGRRTRWLDGERLATELSVRAADSALTQDLGALAGPTIDELREALHPKLPRSPRGRGSFNGPSDLAERLDGHRAEDGCGEG